MADSAKEWERMFDAWVKHQAGLPSDVPLWPNAAWPQDVAMVAHALAGQAKAEVPTPDQMASDERLLNYLSAFENLKTKAPKELVDLVLKHVIDLKPLHWLLIEELCSRVHPGWENEGDEGSQKKTVADAASLRESLRVYGGHIPPCAGRPCACGFQRAWEAAGLAGDQG
jgi:hypothetical protein